MEFYYYHSINFLITFAWINSVINDTLEFPKLLWNKIKFSKTITFIYMLLLVCNFKKRKFKKYYFTFI